MNDSTSATAPELIQFLKSIQPGSGLFKSDYSYATYISLYLFAMHYCEGMEVLDAASGLGYGSLVLARKAKSVVGIDLLPENTEHASATYATGTVSYQTMDATELDFPDASFDRVVSIETFEHVPKEKADLFLSEFKRVLRPGGLLILTTPNRPIHSAITRTPDHVNEVSVDELEASLSGKFSSVEFYYQRKGAFNEMKTFYSVVRTDRLRIRRIIPRRVRNWVNRFVAKDITSDLASLLPVLAVKKAESLDDVRESIIQAVVCGK